MDLTRCPACSAPAEILDRQVLESTDGPIEHAQVRCLRQHAFFLPVERLSSGDPLPARPAVRSGDRDARG